LQCVNYSSKNGKQQRIIGKDMEGNSHDLTSGTIPVFAWRTQENHENLQLAYPVSRYRLVPYEI
jgi:hypothetical protein